MKIPGLPFLTFRTDSLLVKCCVAAVIYYVPQDAAALGGAIWLDRQRSKTIGPSRSVSDMEKSWDSFLARKGLSEKDFDMKRSKNLWVASLR